jgi:hypothetical protein
MTLAGVDSEQYLAIHRQIISGAAPKGLLLHSAGEVDGSWAIFDIWESPAAFEAFSQQLVPVIQAQGLDAQPKIQVTELFNVWTPDLNTLGLVSNDPLPKTVSV